MTEPPFTLVITFPVQDAVPYKHSLNWPKVELIAVVVLQPDAPELPSLDKCRKISSCPGITFELPQLMIGPAPYVSL